MLYSTTLFVAGLAGVAIASPLSIRDENPFIAGAWWDIILDDTATLDQMKEANGSVIDIDLFDNADKGIIKDLAKDKTVICYFSAGSKEEWRDDASEFQPGDTGAPLIKDEDDQTVWDNETWVNVKSESVRAIMKKRIEYAAESGCNAVDPDNVDGYQVNTTGLHQDGFEYDQAEYVDYFNFLAEVAKDNGLAIGLKNAIDMIPDVLDVIDFAVNEQCHEEKECEGYEPVTGAKKAVFNVEYGVEDCSDPENVNLSTIIKPADLELNTLGGIFC